MADVHDERPESNLDQPHARSVTLSKLPGAATGSHFDAPPPSDRFVAVSLVLTQLVSMAKSDYVGGR